MYFSGTVNSNADMLTAINNAVSSGGWTLNSGVLSIPGLAIKLETSTNRLLAQIGTGHSGTTITNPATPKMGLSFSTGSGSAGPISYPAAYHIYVYDDEVYIALNLNTDIYEWMAFGIIKDMPPGEGAFLTGAITDQYAYNIAENRLSNIVGTTPGFLSGRSVEAQSIYADNSNQYLRPPFFYYSNIVLRTSLRGTMEWLSSKNGSSGSSLNQVYSHQIVGDKLLTYSPGDFFYTSAMAQMSFMIRDPGGITGYKIFGRLDNIRMMRNDFVPALNTVTFGSETWQSVPCIRRNPNGTSSNKMSYALRV